MPEVCDEDGGDPSDAEDGCLVVSYRLTPSGVLVRARLEGGEGGRADVDAGPQVAEVSRIRVQLLVHRLHPNEEFGARQEGGGEVLQLILEVLLALVGALLR